MHFRSVLVFVKWEFETLFSEVGKFNDSWVIFSDWIAVTVQTSFLNRLTTRVSTMASLLPTPMPPRINIYRGTLVHINTWNNKMCLLSLEVDEVPVLAIALALCCYLLCLAYLHPHSSYLLPLLSPTFRVYCMRNICLNFSNTTKIFS